MILWFRKGLAGTGCILALWVVAGSAWLGRRMVPGFTDKCGFSARLGSWELAGPVSPAGLLYTVTQGSKRNKAVKAPSALGPELALCVTSAAYLCANISSTYQRGEIDFTSWWGKWHVLPEWENAGCCFSNRCYAAFSHLIILICI